MFPHGWIRLPFKSFTLFLGWNFRINIPGYLIIPFLFGSLYYFLPVIWAAAFVFLFLGSGFILIINSHSIVLIKHWCFFPYRWMKVPLDTPERIKIGFYSDKPDSNWLGLRDSIELTEHAQNEVYTSQDPTLLFGSPRSLTPLGHAIKESIAKQIQELKKNSPYKDSLLLSELKKGTGLVPLKKVIADGASINIESLFGRNIIHYAAQFYEQTEVLDFVLSHHLNINKQDHFGETPLMCAVKKGKLLPALRLIEKECIINKKNRYNQNALHLVFLSSNSEIKKIVPNLINKGIEKNIIDVFGNIPLHYAANFSGIEFEKLFTLLLGNGVSINQKNKQGRTPLHFAAKSGLEKNIKILVSLGANPLIRDNDGNLAGEIASIFSRIQSFSS